MQNNTIWLRAFVGSRQRLQNSASQPNSSVFILVPNLNKTGLSSFMLLSAFVNKLTYTENNILVSKFTLLSSDSFVSHFVSNEFLTHFSLKVSKLIKLMT